MPVATLGVALGGQPMAGAMLTVGISVRAGVGNVGRGPMPAETGNVAVSPQPTSATAIKVIAVAVWILRIPGKPLTLATLRKCQLPRRPPIKVYPSPTR